MTTALVAVDASVIVSALLTWHEHHRSAVESLEAALEDGVILPVPVLVEAYAVMTRLPAPHRLRAADAHRLLFENFGAFAQVDGLTGHECWAMLASLAAEGTAGGRTYDAHILEVALKRGASVLLTLNTSHFEALAQGRIEFRSPLD